MRVLYFTFIPLIVERMGGTICCRNHIRRLASDPDIELFVLATGPEAWRAETRAFLTGLKIPYRFEAWADFVPCHKDNSLGGIARFAAAMIFQFPWEVVAMEHRVRIDKMLDEMIAEHGIEALVIDYHPSAQFLTLPRRDVRTLLIGLNRQADLYRERLQQGLVHHGKLTGAISLWRYRKFEKRANQSVDKVITIGPADIPAYKLRTPPVCITPVLDPVPEGWRYSATRRAFYVGDITRSLSNRLAIQWICERLAPALLEIGSDVRISVVGAETGQLEKPPPGNVELLGRANNPVLDKLFKSADIMLCPVENDYGVKIKTLEALAYGTPLLASHQSLVSLGHLPALPAIDLNQPVAAARLLADLLNDRARLEALHAYETETQANFAAEQQHVWSRTIGTLMANVSGASRG